MVPPLCRPIGPQSLDYLLTAARAERQNPHDQAAVSQ